MDEHGENMVMNEANGQNGGANSPEAKGQGSRRFSVYQVVLLGLMAAVSIVLAMLVHFPLMPAAPYLEYDPADIPILIIALVQGPIPALLLTVAVSLVQGLTVSAGSGPIGIIMHILSTGSFALVAGRMYQKNHTRNGALQALGLGVITMTAMMLVCNYFLTPIYLGVPRAEVVPILMPVIFPFNLVKALINGLGTFLIYRPLSSNLRPKKQESWY